MAFFQSFGAAGQVTGSCHLLEINDTKILIDCGMFQGEDKDRNEDPFGFDPASIDFLLVTHAHLDHIGRIPLLVKQGFKGEILCTRATFAISRLMLHNAGGLQESTPRPLYTLADVDPALSLFKPYIQYGEPVKLEEGIEVVFQNAGHILGSATLKLTFKEQEGEKSVIFSGDIGQEHRIITSAITPYDSADYLFLESTYGDRMHKNLNISIMEFKTYIEDALRAGSTVLIPSFALERTQEVLYILRQLSLQGKLQGVPVFLDAPLAINVTRTFLNYPSLFSDEINEMMRANINPFDFEELVNTESKDASSRIAGTPGAKIIIAGSGMCEGGRVTHHLLRYLGDENALIVFVGYQVPSTLGYRILHNKKGVEIEGTYVPKNAVVKSVDGFSAHADQDDMLRWVEAIKGLRHIYLIHGDKERQKQLQNVLRSLLHTKVHLTKMGRTITL